jgi:hypothetical protein
MQWLSLHALDALPLMVLWVALCYSFLLIPQIIKTFKELRDKDRADKRNSIIWNKYSGRFSYCDPYVANGSQFVYVFVPRDRFDAEKPIFDFCICSKCSDRLERTDVPGSSADGLCCRRCATTYSRRAYSVVTGDAQEKLRLEVQKVD